MIIGRIENKVWINIHEASRVELIKDIFYKSGNAAIRPVKSKNEAPQCPT